MRTGSLDSSRLLKFYVVAVVAGATAALALASVHPEWDNSDKFLNGFIAILAVGLAAEISSVRLHVGSSILSIAFIPFLAATFLFPPVWAMILGGITVFSVECLVRKKPWIKVVFNTSKEILAIGLAASVFQFLGGEPSVYAFPKVPFAFVAASVTYAATNSMTVSFAVSLAEGLDFYERSEEHTSELQSPCNLVCRLLLEKKKKMQMSVVLLELNGYESVRTKISV